MAKQSTKNYEALKARQDDAPIFKELFLKTEPVYNKYHLLLGDIVSVKAIKKGTTLSFKNILKTLRSKLKEWDLQIQMKFKEGTPAYIMLFPNGKSFILEGTQEQIIAKFKGFQNNVESNPELTSIKQEVKEFNLMLMEIYGTKSEKFTNKDTTSTELDKAYDEMGKILHYNMLMLAAFFIDDTSQVEDFFDMTLLRTSEKDDTTEETSLLVNIPVASSVDSGFKVREAGKYLVISRCVHTLQFYGASTPTELPKTTPRELLPGEEIEVTGTELEAPTNRYLIFINPNTTSTGEVEILEVD